ncbi:unnamed protein product [Brassica oleracea]
MEDDGVLNEKGNEEEACEEEARDMEEDGTAQDDEIPSTEGVELAGEEVKKKKKKRGPTKLHRVAENPNDKIMVTFNDIGEHVGPGSVTLSSFLGPLVKEHVQVTLADWRKLDAATKATMWEEIQGRFNLQEEWQKAVIFKQLGNVWRAGKSRLVSQVRVAKTAAERIALKPSNIPSLQLCHFVPLGPNASNVWIDVAKIGDAKVWRPNSEIEYISDAMGSVVAWPNDKIKFV